MCLRSSTTRLRRGSSFPYALDPSARNRLKWKFLALQRGLHFKLAHAPLIIDACCVLYNFIFLHEGTWTSHQPLDDAQTRNGTGRSQGAASSGVGERAAEADYLAANFLNAGVPQVRWRTGAAR